MDCKIFTRIGTEKPQVIPSCALSDPFVPAQFCIVRKYEDLYAEALPRFTKSKRTPYALPAANKAMHTYCGIDRDPLKYTPDDFHMYSYRDALTHFNTLSKPDAELIFIRAVGCDAPIPEGMFLLGYDAAWTFGLGICDGFSAICDCMFLCRWHGCDKEGTEFSDDFRLLNSHGLFSCTAHAEKYLLHYLNQDWSEEGEYCIYEIYR